MSHVAVFNYYDELEVAKSATLEEIISSYRRLALIHHPDRSFGDSQAATAKFQRLSEAYETLSEPTKRVMYDLALATGTSYSASASASASARDDDRFGFPPAPGFPFAGSMGSRGHDFSAFPRGFQVRHLPMTETYFHRGLRHGQYSRVFGRRPQAPASTTQPPQRQEDEEAQARRQAEAQKEAAEKAEQDRQAEFQRQKKARELAKKEADKKKRDAAEALKNQIVESRLKTDGEEQEALWSQQNATTVEEKQATCLHAVLWQKMKQSQKLKCESCFQKRGVFGFKCPYCEILVCQLCQSQVVEKKMKELNEAL